MKRRAIFLLIVFLLNTVVGLGCDVGMQGRSPGLNHCHKESAYHEHKGHDHQHSSIFEYKRVPASGNSFSDQDFCCKNLVNALVTQSKLIPDNLRAQFALRVIMLPELSHALSISLLGLERLQSIYVGQKERPPNEEIRIVIQSFQI